MHTRNRSRHGRHTVSGNKDAFPAEWLLVLWLGVVLLSVEAAVALVLLLSSLHEKIEGLALSGFSGDNAASAAAYSAATNLYWTAKSAVARALRGAQPDAADAPAAPATANRASSLRDRRMWDGEARIRVNDYRARGRCLAFRNGQTRTR